MDVVLQNQDNREHDLLDSNDYYQFQGGMVAAVRHLAGNQPQVYHADHSNPNAPRVRTLHEEIARVIRSRVVNPKWLDGVKRHGYKGAAEIAATVDYLYGYDATARVIADHQYALVTDAYLNDADTREFMQQHNPHALHSICERLLEAMQRGLWQSAGRLSRASRTASARERAAHRRNTTMNAATELRNTLRGRIPPAFPFTALVGQAPLQQALAACGDRSGSGRRAGQWSARHRQIDSGARAGRTAARRATGDTCRSARAKTG